MKRNYLILSAIVALAGFLPQGKAQVTLGSATNFAALAGSTVTSAGDTVLNGDLGVYPGTAITGFTFSTPTGPGIVNGTTYAGVSPADQAEADVLTAYNILLGETPNQDLSGQDLGGQILLPGVYKFDSTAQLTGTLTLSGTGDFVFQVGSTLTTASAAYVLLVGGAQADNVYWQVGSAATLGAGTSFDGSILADSSITLDVGTSMTGRALAMNGAVSLADNTLTVPVDVPEPGSFRLLALGASVLGAWRRKAGRS